MRELSFKTNARHIGQLGRELVTDFVTALVELIKNSYDADAECAKIVLQDVKSTQGRIIVADCGDGMSSYDFENKWMVIGTSNKLSEPYTRKGRKKAGKKGIGRFSVERLAEHVAIYSFMEKEKPFCVKIDWNRFEELDILAMKQRIDILLHRKDREAAKYLASQMQYALTLDVVKDEDRKMIRSIVGDNYSDYTIYFNGEILNNLTKIIVPLLQEYEGYRQLIEDIKTPLIDVEDLESCEAYQILKELCHNAGKDSITGTVMILEQLRDDWTQKAIDKLQKELRLLVAPNFLENDPFFIEFKASEFVVEEIISVNDIINTNFAKLEARISNNGQKSFISYEDRNGIKKQYENEYKIPLLCGNVTFELYYFLRDPEHMQLEGYNYRFVTKVLDTYCGIKIYRDKFRVKPYGESGNDWLFLDKEKVKDTHGYLVGNNQTIGRVNISDESNPLLVDATNREGIIENEAFEQLQAFIKECIAVISETRKEAYEEEKKERLKLEAEKKKIEEEKKELTKEHDAITGLLGNLVETTKNVDKRNGMVAMVQEFADVIQSYHQKQKEYQQQYEENAEKRYKLVQNALNHAMSELATYKNLASLGMLAGEFGHETSDVVNRIQNAVFTVIRTIQNEPTFATSLQVLNIVKDDFRRIASYSDMIIAFLRKRKRESCEELNVKSVISEICGYYEEILKEFHIELKHECDEKATLNMRQIDLESIVINLITNAYAQLKVCEERKILIRAWQEKDFIRIRVDDSGPGVPAEERERIFKAFITSKEDGIGLGLNIVHDIVVSYGGTVKCEESALYCGACFAVDFELGDDEDVNQGSVH